MSKPRRERRSVTAVEAVGPYVLIHLDRGGIDPGVPGQFFMLEAPGRVLPRPMSLCLAPRGELAFLLDPVGLGTRALAAVERGDRLHVFGPLATASGSTRRALLRGRRDRSRCCRTSRRLPSGRRRAGVPLRAPCQAAVLVRTRKS
jgi:hypothetical protein